MSTNQQNNVAIEAFKSKEKFIPQIDTDHVNRSAQQERYNAYMKHFYKPEMKEKVDIGSCNKTIGM